MIKRKFKIENVEIASWHTDFSVKDLDHSNKENEMSPECFFHHLMELCGKSLDEMEGFEFEVILPIDSLKDDKETSVNMCGQVIKR